MTLPIRRPHRRVLAVLAVLLLSLIPVGLALRRGVSHAETPPPDPSSETLILTETHTFTATGDERDDLFGESPVRVRLFRDHGSGAFAIGLSASKEFIKPDLTVYWSAAKPTTRDTLPSDARLLGACVSTTLPPPPEASITDGCLILFSPANREIVDVSKPTRFGDPTR